MRVRPVFYGRPWDKLQKALHKKQAVQWTAEAVKQCVLDLQPFLQPAAKEKVGFLWGNRGVAGQCCMLDFA